jgi:hemolysin activation/secretion protein
MVRKESFKAVSGALLFLMTVPGWALVEAQLPGSVMPEQVARSLTKPESNVTPKAPLVAPTAPESSNLGPEAKKIKFTLNGIVLEGNTIYKTPVLSQLYKKKLHKSISVADLFEIVQDVTNYYRNNGYILTRAILPPQHVKNGVVRIRIVEGYIGKVDVAGHPRGAKCLVQAYGEEIAKCKPLRLKRMERYLLIANTIPATQVKAVLTPSKTQLGAADMSLLTENSPVTGYLSYDNYGTRYIGPQQITANIALNSAITSGDSTQFTVTKTPKGGELTYGDLNYNMALGPDGTRFLIGGTRVHTHPLFVLTPFQIDGLNNNYYTNLQYPLIRTREENLVLQAGFNYLDSEVTASDFLLYNDHIRSLDLGFSYNFADRYSGVNFVSSDIRQGLPILGYTSNTNPDTAQTSRAGGRGDYTKFNIQASRMQYIYGPFSAYGLARGQWAFNPLLASEQFSFGGSQFGRGYDVAEIIGDKGLGGTLEVRYEWNIARFYIQTLQLYAFYDGAKIWNFKNISGTPTIQSATSAGFGSRFYLTKYISGNLMWTQSLTKSVAAEELIGDGRRPRIFFSVVASLD